MRVCAPSARRAAHLHVGAHNEERARLAEVLLESLQGAPLAEIEAAWDREIDR
ncbi:MAG: hypothetical protein EPO20_17780 [Betaproteobacteria bacterium]|nr:MAG: hypothetical protein EPO20_17780 [Betaproteobacteria bacterium]